MRRLVTLCFVLALVPGCAVAQGRLGAVVRAPQGVPPGQLPPAGLCRVWFNGLPPGRQPAPTTCREAERIAAQSRNARVIYGAGAPALGQTRGDVRKRGPLPARNPSPVSVAFDQGYEDGYAQGWDDADDGDAYNAVGHARYRSANHGYNSRLGSRAAYARIYREGFRAGYDAAYRDVRSAGRTRPQSGGWFPRLF